MRLEPLISGLLFASALIAAPDQPPVTFSKDVLPVLQKNCQGCHRPGEAAPFSLLTYEEAKPWARAMKEAVLLHKMPPWFADPHVGKFANDPSLSQKESPPWWLGLTRALRGVTPRMLPHHSSSSKAGGFRSRTS
jgi:hypothetical protein